MAAFASGSVTVGDSMLVTVYARLASADDRASYGVAIGEIEEWCRENGYHQTENWPPVKTINGQTLLVSACVRN